MKSWETLEKEMQGVTSLMCCQDFAATKQDSYNDNKWDETQEEGWKCDTIFRMLDENLDYGPYNETDEEYDDDFDEDLHSELMEIRCDISDKVAEKWLNSDEICNLETAQKYADELVKQVELSK